MILVKVSALAYSLLLQRGVGDLNPRTFGWKPNMLPLTLTPHISSVSPDCQSLVVNVVAFHPYSICGATGS